MSEAVEEPEGLVQCPGWGCWCSPGPALDLDSREWSLRICICNKVGADAAGLQIIFLVARMIIYQDSHILCISLTYRGC